MNHRGNRKMWWLCVVVGGKGLVPGFEFECMAWIDCEVGCLMVRCIWQGDSVMLVVGFGWVGIVLGRRFIGGRMLMKLVGMDQTQQHNFNCNPFSLYLKQHAFNKYHMIQLQILENNN